MAVVVRHGRFDDPAGIVIDRDTVNEQTFGVTRAKTFPPYVFSTTKNSLLVHKIAYVELHWYRIAGFDHLVKLSQPIMIAKTICGNARFLRAEKARTCQVPNPDAILCGRCHGEPHSFGKEGYATKGRVSKRWANVQLGCVVNGYSR